MIRVGDNLKRSFSSFGTAYEMEDMCGKMYKIEAVIDGGRGIRLRHPNGSTYVFRSDDVSLVKPKKVKVPKELFDPLNLVEIENE